MSLEYDDDLTETCETKHDIIEDLSLSENDTYLQSDYRHPLSIYIDCSSYFSPGVLALMTTMLLLLLSFLALFLSLFGSKNNL